MGMRVDCVCQLNVNAVIRFGRLFRLPLPTEESGICRMTSAQVHTWLERGRRAESDLLLAATLVGEHNRVDVDSFEKTIEFIKVCELLGMAIDTAGQEDYQRVRGERPPFHTTDEEQDADYQIWKKAHDEAELIFG